MSLVHPHQDENMYYMAQSFLLSELKAGRLSVSDPILNYGNVTDLFFEEDYFPDGDDGITFEFTILDASFRASYRATMPQTLSAETHEGYNVKFVETIVVERII